MMKGWWSYFLLIAALGVTAASFLAPPAKLFAEPDLARIIFFHLPCAFTTTVFLFAGAWFAYRYLRSSEEHWDVRSSAAIEIGFMFSVLTMATGILFSKVQWGDWWQWDPRQTSFLFVLLIYSAYLALRASLPSDERRARNSAAYGVFAIVPTIFLIFVVPRLPSMAAQTFHPNATIQDTVAKTADSKGGFDRTYWMIVLATFVVLLFVAIRLYALRVRAGLLELELEQGNGKLEAGGGDSAPTGVVRRVDLSEKD